MQRSGFHCGFTTKLWKMGDLVICFYRLWQGTQPCRLFWHALILAILRRYGRRICYDDGEVSFVLEVEATSCQHALIPWSLQLVSRSQMMSSRLYGALI